ncbi:MAG: matrixin family metalloprotease [Planctomycetota bacterium]|jgi:hypothetical protein
MRHLLVAIILIAVIALVSSTAGCSKSHKSSRDGGPPSGGGGGGGGNVNFGDYVPGTDKWHVEFDQGALSQACQTANLSGQESEVMSAALSQLGQAYGELQISFSTDPLSGGSTPPPGQTVPVAQLGPNPYNVMKVWSGNTGASGLSIIDSSGSNGMIENDSGNSGMSGSQLGVFINVIADVYQSAHGDVNKFGGLIAITLAHEIGHSLGLGHDDASSNIMNSMIGPSTSCVFSSQDTSELQSLLPGPGRD